MTLLTVDGREYKELIITGYSVKLEVLDGPGTGRSKSKNWPMIRQPQGTIINLSIEAAANSSDNPDFRHLWGTCVRMGETDFVPVRFVDPAGAVIEQSMYLVAAELKIKHIEIDGTVYSDVLQVSFVAQKGYGNG